MRKTLLLVLLMVFTPVLALAKPKVVASINPIYQILTAIVGEKAEVALVVNPKLSGHHYQLKNRDVRAIHEADLVFYVDDELERNLVKLVSNEKSARELSGVSGIKLLDQRGFLKQMGRVSKKMDLHIWLNPRNAIKIAEFMVQEVALIDPKNSQIYQRNLFEFKKKIFLLEEKLFRVIENSTVSSHVLFTQDYQYFEEYFRVKPLKVILSSHDHGLRMSDVREFNLLLQKGRVKCVFGDVYDESNAVQKLAKNHGLRYVALNLIGFGGDYFKILEEIADGIASCD